jgi:basic membrane protein A
MAEPVTAEPATESPAIGIAIAGGTDEATQSVIAAGADRASADFGVEVTYFWLDDQPMIGLQEAAAASDVVLVTGFGLEAALGEMADGYPDVAFVLVDSSKDRPNIASTRIATNQAAFIAGAAAALTSETGKVGFVGALPMDVITTLEAGFRAGAAAADPGVEVLVAYLGEMGDFAAFSDPERGRTAAADLYGQGADVVMNGAAGSGAGIFAEAVQRRAGGDRVWAIGVDYDQAAGADADTAAVILTSAVRHLDAAIYWAIEHAVAGTLPLWEEVRLGFAEGAVGYATTGGHLEGIMPDLEALVAGIIDGSVTVPVQP